MRRPVSSGSEHLEDADIRELPDLCEGVPVLRIGGMNRVHNMVPQRRSDGIYPAYRLIPRTYIPYYGRVQSIL